MKYQKEKKWLGYEIHVHVRGTLVTYWGQPCTTKATKLSYTANWWSLGPTSQKIYTYPNSKPQTLIKFIYTKLYTSDNLSTRTSYM